VIDLLVPRTVKRRAVSDSYEKAKAMETDDRFVELEQDDAGHDTGALENTDIDSDEEMDGEVDAGGAGAIGQRND